MRSTALRVSHLACACMIMGVVTNYWQLIKSLEVKPWYSDSPRVADHRIGGPKRRNNHSREESIETTLNRTALVWTTGGVTEACEAARIKHLVDTSGMDVWILVNRQEMEKTKNFLLSQNIQNLHYWPQNKKSIQPFDGDAGSSKSSFLKFLMEHSSRYDFGWMMENDVFYAGPWLEFFREEMKDKFLDFVSPENYWHGFAGDNWYQLEKKPCHVDGIECTAITRFQNSCILSRISTNLATSLYQDFVSGKAIGHCEAIFGPYTLKRGFSMGESDPIKKGAHFVFGHVGKREDELKLAKSRLIDFYDPRVATLIHPVRCNGYEGQNATKIYEHIDQYANRPLMSEQEIWNGYHRDWDVQTLPIYWINSDRARKQRDQVESSLLKLGPWAVEARRVPLINELDVLTLLENGRLICDQSWLLKVSQDEVLANLSKLVSHFTAIAQAYEEGHSNVLIIEDDAMLSRLFFRDRQSVEGRAPSDWQVLQWSATRRETLQQNFKLSDPWLSWVPEQNGTHAYSINRRGMKEALNKVHSVDENGRDIWQLSGSEQNPLFSFAGPTYTSTDPWIHNEATLKALNIPMPVSSQKWIDQLHQSILVWNRIQLRSHSDLQKEIHRLQMDSKTLCRHHLNHVCEWIIEPIVGEETLVHELKMAVKNFSRDSLNEHFEVLPPNVSIDSSIPVIPTQYLGRHDLLLIKDGEQRIAGFPWGSFVRSRGDAFVASALAKALWTSMESRKEWSIALINKRTHHEVANTNPIPTDTIESYFTLLDGKFANDFYSNHSSKQTLNSNDWCRETGSTCVVIPFFSLYEGTPY